MQDELSTFVIELKEENGPAADLKWHCNAERQKGQEQHQILIDAITAGNMVVMATMDTVVHGTLSDDGTPATLIVMSFHFLPSSNNKRFKSAEIQVQFFKGQNATTGPEVYKISPCEGVIGMEPTTETVSNSGSWNNMLQLGYNKTNAKLGYKWKFTKNFDKERFARLVSARRTLGSDRSKKNSATWRLLENPVTKSGTMSHLRTAILLTRERTDDDTLGEKFSAKVTIKATLDWQSRMQETAKQIGQAFRNLYEKSRDQLGPVRGEISIEEGVIFNPALDMGGVKNKNRLLEEDLEKLSEITMLEVRVQGNQSSEQETANPAK